MFVNVVIDRPIGSILDVFGGDGEKHKATIERTILSYIRDAAYMGKGKACFNIGHFNMEELGMKYAADWIGELVNDEVPVYYVPTKDTWSFL